MGNVVGGRESIDDEAACGIFDFERCFGASLEDASPGVIREPLQGYVPSTGPPTTVRRGSVDTINEPLVGRLVTVHMMETNLILRETVGVVDQTVTSMPYTAIRRLTWDHSQSSLKLGHAPVKDSESGSRGQERDPDYVYLSIRVENSLELEDELQQRAKAESKRATDRGEEPKPTPESVYLGMFAGFTKPKPFQRKRPNLSSIVAEGALPSLKDMRSWSLEDHKGVSRPQVISLRPMLGMDTVFLGGNSFPLTNVDGLSVSAPDYSTLRQRSRCAELVFTFAGIEVQLGDDRVEDVSLTYDVIDDWTVIAASSAGPRASSGLEIFILPQGSKESDEPRRSRRRSGKEVPNKNCRGEDADSVSPVGSRSKSSYRIFLGVPDESIALTRNAMEFFWNRRRAELRQPPKPGTTHGRRVASKLTLRGEVRAPTPPKGRVDPVRLEGVEIRPGEEMQRSPKRGQVNLMPNPRAILGVEKKRTLRYNAQARPHWKRVVLHQGWLRKRGGGAIKRWIWRYFVLYDTPQGHFLAYYHDASDVPLFTETRRERQVIDLCKVCFLRPEICQPRLSECEIPANAFTIVTTERQWTLCADSKVSLMQWLRMLSVAIDEDVAIVDDGEALYHVKVQWSPDGNQYGPECPATVHVGSMGMELRWGYLDPTSPLSGYTQPMRVWGGNDGGARVMASGKTRFWSFTDFYKWTLVVLHDGTPGLAIQCFTDETFITRENILLVTPRSKQLTLVIEHQIEKFMALMHLRLEIQGNYVVASSVPPTPSDCVSTDSPDAPEDDESEPRPSLRSRHTKSMNLATDPGMWVGQIIRTGGRNNPFDFLSGEDFEDGEETDVDAQETIESPVLSEVAEVANGSASDPWGDLLDLSSTHVVEEKGAPLDGENGALATASLGAKDVTFAWGSSSSPLARIPQSYPPAIPPISEDIGRERGRNAAESLYQPHSFRPHPGAPQPTGPGGMMPAPPTPDFGQARMDPEGFDFSSATHSSGDSATTSSPAATGSDSPPTYKPLLTALNTKSSPGSTPPVTPHAATLFEDAGGEIVTSSFMPQQAGGTLPVFALAGDHGGNRNTVQPMHSNPFVGPRSRVVLPPGEQLVKKATGEVLYDDRAYMRITLESCVKSGISCFLRLRYELSALVPLSSVTVDLMPGPTTSSVSALFDPFLESLDVGREPGGRAELRQTISLSCSRPFSSPPEIAVVVASGGRDPPAITRVSLPVTVSAFLRGMPMSTDEFRQRWTTLSSSGQTTQAIVDDGCLRGGPRWSASVEPSDVRRTLFDTMGMADVPWRDKGGAGAIDLIAASGFLSASGGIRERGLIVCLVGVELHATTGAARVTTKSTDRVLAEDVQREILLGIDVARGVHR